MTYWVEMKWLKQEGGEEGEFQRENSIDILLTIDYAEKKLFRFMRACESGIFVAGPREEANREM